MPKPDSIPPMLKSTDSPDPSALSWYTTPEGSRIAELDTQGDQSGGGIIAWLCIHDQKAPSSASLVGK